MIGLDSPVASILGDQGGKRRGANKLAKIQGDLGLATVGELLRHFPRRYVRTGELTRVADLEKGQVLTIVGEIATSEVRSYVDRRTGRRAYRLDTELATDGPSLRMSFFAKNGGTVQFQATRLRKGRTGVFIGTVSSFGGRWQLTNPKMVLFGDDEGPGPGGTVGEGEDSGADARGLAAVGALKALFPIYPLTKGVESWDLQSAIAFALSVLDDVDDMIPGEIREAYDVIGIRPALDWIHAPDDYGQVTTARARFRFEEALTTQLVLGRRRRALQAQGGRVRDGARDDGSRGGLLAAFDQRLPFILTRGQQEVGAQLETDLARPHPMNRLLQGEVGSGKTLVALRAMLRTIDSGGQSALLAPTEVLAQQHHRSITALLGDLSAGGMLGGAEEATGVELLTGSMTRTQRTEPLLRLASGESGIVIGTHALLEDTVMFADLGLVVVDEQHRFGVEQRAALTDKAGTPPHVLVMTATPIPRTVAMTVFGDLEISTLRELPAGRAPIQSTVVPLDEQPRWMDRVWERVREEVAAGHQAYVVCPRITGDQLEQGESDVADRADEVETDIEGGGEGQGTAAPPGSRPRSPTAVGLHAVEDVVSDLAHGALTGLRVHALHGAMTPDDKDRTMRDFAAGAVDVLISTTVIEVGVDVANATVMVLLDADRFGISQLHQLRGRVGRGGLPGLCLLVTRAQAGSPARERIEAVAATTDGFELSRVDLELRQEGDVVGRSQSGWRSGLTDLKVLRDEKTIVAARAAAESLLDADIDLGAHPTLAAAVRAMEESVASAFMDKS